MYYVAQLGHRRFRHSLLTQFLPLGKLRNAFSTPCFAEELTKSDTLLHSLVHTLLFDSFILPSKALLGQSILESFFKILRTVGDLGLILDFVIFDKFCGFFLTCFG